jgi:serine/threonine protein kinase
MIGKIISHYKIIEKLGEGGMGTVYKAQDTKLERFVALKFLPSQLTATDEEKARFIQEAKAASAMNHPNVCTIYDIQEKDSQLFIVMEFVEGKTLKDKKDNISEKQILEIGIQAAEGLAAAHEKGIVHRDIKPENIMIRKDGIVQIMDFGLAKLQSVAGASRLTKAGTAMGTIGYMSPEQVQGLDVDHRTDIFSLGVVLYEMFAGEAPFKGMHETAIMYEIVNVDPEPISSIKPEINSEIDSIILECLEKEPAERFQSAAEIARNLRRLKRDSGKTSLNRTRFTKTAIQNESNLPRADSKTGQLKKSIYKKIFIAASFLLVAILAAFVTWYLYPEPERDVRKFEWSIDYNLFTLSPDGKKIAYSSGEKLWIRPLDKIDPIEIKNNEHISNIIWSPNNNYIAYFTGLETDNHQLRKVSVNGTGNSLIVKMESNYYPRFWGIDDSILVTTWDNNGVNTLLKVPSSGGELKPICGGDTALSTINGNLTHVLGLPDGKSLLLSNYDPNLGGKIIVQTAEKRTTLYNAPEGFIGKLVFSSNNYILYPLSIRGNSVPDIWAMPFDASSLEVTGNPFLVARNADHLSVSQSGMLFYIDPGNGSGGEQLVLLTRSGQLLKKIGQPQLEIYTPMVSPDGNLVATMSTETGETYDIWLHDLIKETKSQLSFDIPQTWNPSWSPDGKEIVFVSGFFEKSDIYIQSTNGRTSAKPLIISENFEGSPHWSSDGRFILFSKAETLTRTQFDIWYLEMGKEKSAKPLFESRFNEDNPSLSPDGRFVSFQSDKSGQMEIYVTNFPEANKQWQVSFEGGHYPQWIGNEIFFVSPRKNTLMTVKVKTNSGFQSEKPEELFSANTAGVQLQTNYAYKYTITKDGKNIIAVKPLTDSVQPKLVLVENWFEEFKERK